MKYENSKCSGCGKGFGSGDDIVVCPECGTPQHRKCYDENGGCVNSALHKSGFVWHDENAVTAAKDGETTQENPADDSLVCPRCGAKNEKGSTVCSKCGQKFTLFGFNIVEKQQQLEREEEEDRRQKQQSGFGELSSNGDELPEITQVIDERVKLLAPGIQPEQKQEILCGHTIDKVIAFVGYGAKTYVKKFRAIRDGKKLSVNWAALFFSPFWFFFRKQYKAGIIFTTLNIILSMLTTVPMEKMSAIIGGYTMQEVLALPVEQQQLMSQQLMQIMPVLALLNFLIIVLAVISGLIADKMYYKYVERSLNEIEEAKDNTFALGLLAQKGATSRWAPLIALAVIWVVPMIISMLFGG